MKKNFFFFAVPLALVDFLLCDRLTVVNQDTKTPWVPITYFKDGEGGGGIVCGSELLGQKGIFLGDL